MNGHIWGYLAEFETPEELVEAVRKVREEGYRNYEAHTPFPVEDLAEELEFEDERVDILHVVGFIVFGAAMLGIMYWANVISYPLNIGGRPLASWPAFALPTFEMATLGGTVAGVVTMLVLNRLPDRQHPLLSVESFHLASDSKFFISIRASDPMFDGERTRRFLEQLGPVRLDPVMPTEEGEKA